MGLYRNCSTKLQKLLKSYVYLFLPEKINCNKSSSHWGTWLFQRTFRFRLWLQTFWLPFARYAETCAKGRSDYLSCGSRGDLVEIADFLIKMLEICHDRPSPSGSPGDKKRHLVASNRTACRNLPGEKKFVQSNCLTTDAGIRKIEPLLFLLSVNRRSGHRIVKIQGGDHQSKKSM